MPYFGNEPAKVAMKVGSGVITATEIQDASISTADIANDAITPNQLDDDGTGFQVGTLGVGTAVSGSEKLTVGGTASFSGEVDAASLDISGDVDVDGTLETDALTIGGTTLAETIADTVGAMVGSNTETGISVTYEDSDNTLDFALSTITSLGTISTGVWNGTAIASAYLDSDTAHLSGTQTFSGAKTFSAEAKFTDNININGSGTRQIKFDDGAESEGAIVFDEITDGFIFKVGGTSGSSKVDAFKIANDGTATFAGDVLVKSSGVVTCFGDADARDSDVPAQYGAGCFQYQFQNGASNRGAILELGGDVGAGETMGALTFFMSGNTDGDRLRASIDGVGTGGTDAGGRLRFSTAADGATTPTYRMIIREDGKVGIGTDSPKNYLHVSDGSTSNLSLSDGIIITDASNPKLVFEDTGEGTDDKVIMFNYYDEALRIMSSNDDQSSWNKTAIAVFNRDGNVSIGGTTTDYPLSIWNDIGSYSLMIDNDNGASQGLFIKCRSNDANQTSRSLIKAQSYGSGSSFTDKFKLDIEGNATFYNDVTITSDNNPALLITSNEAGTDNFKIYVGGTGLSFYNTTDSKAFHFRHDGDLSFGHDGATVNTKTWGNAEVTGNLDAYTIKLGGDWLFEEVSSTTVRIAEGFSTLQLLGAMSKGSGSFQIDHPLPSKKDTHYLVHSFTESPRADLIYRDKVTLVDGSATVNIDTVAGMTEGTFVLLCDDVQCFTSNESDWKAVKGSVSGNILTIECEDSNSTADVAWMVIGDRKDKHILETPWTDENGKPIIEPEKESA